MRLSAALVPPPAVRDDLAETVRAVRGKPTELELVPAEQLYVWLGNFGNVSHADTETLKEALSAEIRHLQPLQLYVHAGTALDSERDDSVWANLHGDVAAVETLVRVLPQVARRLGFMTDRRGMRPSVRVGRITADTTAEYLQRVLDRLQGYCGQTWVCDELVLLRAREVDEEPEKKRYEPLHRLPFGRAASHADGAQT